MRRMGRFFDPEPDPGADGRLRLELSDVDGREFRLLHPIGYDAPGHAEPFVVPPDLADFRTDLASVPAMFTWLVPKSGVFLPAAVLHDGMVDDDTYLGPRVDRYEADRIFRDACIDLGTGRVRGWLMWAAVTLGTMWNSGSLWSRVRLVGLLGIVVVLGVLATFDLVDVWDVLPWMAERSLGGELLGGALGALIIPSVLALTWGRLAPAGIIASVALALLLHVTLVIGLLSLGYQVLERLVSGPPDSRGIRPGVR